MGDDAVRRLVGFVAGDITREPLLAEVHSELIAQDVKWGEQNHPNGTGGPTAQAAADELRAMCDTRHHAGAGTWTDILTEEIAEAFAETDPAALRAELVQVAAVAVQWVAAIDRAQAPS